MSLSLLPCATIWLALFAAAAFAWQRPLHGLSIAAATVGYAGALAFGKLEPIALAPLALLAAAAWGVAPGRPLVVRIASHVVFAALAIALSLHLLPGFHNPRVIEPTRFTPDAVPFTMYLNFDKPLVGLWLLWALPWVAPDVPLARALRTGAVAAAATAAACLAGALAFGMVGWAPKWPASGWIWLVNNVLLVTLAEEALFRGYVQGGSRACSPGSAGGRGPRSRSARYCSAPRTHPAAGSGSCSGRRPASATGLRGGAAGCSRPRSRTRD